jgi:nifR3 family TIM-barrel protein
MSDTFETAGNEPGAMRSMRLGQLVLFPPLVLAPMAGLSHAALRQLIEPFGGCGLYVSEMLSCRAVVHERPGSSFHLGRFAGERPFFYQLVGNDPEAMARAIEHLERVSEESGAPVDGFDINMGCAAPQVRNRGLGCGLMRDPDLAAKVVAACRRATTLPLTVKMRLGREEAFESTAAFGRMLEDGGVDAVTLHPRLAKERFRRRARWRYVGMLKRELHIPVIGNGDIACREDVQRRVNETACDGVMIGRMAVRKPWIFREIAGFDEAMDVDMVSVWKEFLELLKMHLPPERRLGRLKEFTHYYAGNFRFGHRLATSVQNAGSLEEAAGRAGEFFERHESECLYRMPGRGM